MTLGYIRRAIGLSQSELAKKSGVSVRTIQAFEAGRREITKASGEIIFKLSKALGIQMETFWEDSQGEE